MDTMILWWMAIGLSMDACAVAISRGMHTKEPSYYHAARMGIVFGFFQGVMPCIGFIIGKSAQSYIHRIDHWIAFVILTALGSKMLWESYVNADNNTNAGWPTLGTLLLLGVATSIDALAAGITLISLEVSMLCAAVVIAGVTFFMTFICAYFASNLSATMGRFANRSGGFLLIALGAWILLNHLLDPL